ncbi:MAG: hypothetical protein FWG58_05245 [Methanomassiliicoccaceae archaeon]|nr:hypothetical protein [Methanomassiliicoccaceae archaeon]
MLGAKEIILLETSISLGEFDPTVDGAYRNVKTFPLPVKQGKKLFLTVISDRPVDIALSNGDGICIKFKDGILDDTIGPLEMTKKETMALLVGIYRGDKAELKIKVWME